MRNQAIATAFLVIVISAGFALPLNAVRNNAKNTAQADAEDQLVVSDAPANSHAGYLGVGLRDVTDDRVAGLKLKDARGVEIIAVDHDGPAGKIGMHEHDVILQMNGQDIAGGEQLRRILRETPAGRKADFVVSRDGQEMKFEVVLGDRAQLAHASWPDMENLKDQISNLRVNVDPATVVIPDLSDLSGPDDLSLVYLGNPSGAVVESLGPQLAKYFGAKDGVGVLVKEVRPDSAAAKAGLRAGDVIVRAGGQPVAGRAQWERLLRDNRGKSVTVEVLRDKREQKLMLAVAARTQSELGQHGFDFNAPELNAQLEKNMAEMRKQFDSAEWKKQVEQASAEAGKAAAEWQKNGTALKEELQRAQDEYKKAAEQWNPEAQKQVQQEIQKEMEQLQNDLREAGEQMRFDGVPLD